MSGPGTLKKLAQRSTVEREAELERCELCGAGIPASHSHVLELATRDVKCACRPCGLLFDRADRMRLIPTDVLAADAVDVPWEELRLPVDIAFFFVAAGEMKCFYPSPMGPTECLLPVSLDVELEDDVQALLVNRVRGAHRQWIVGIDVCYELVGLIRMHWRGFTGGAEVWRALDSFWDGLDRAAALMVELGFSVLGASRVEHVAVPTLRFELRVTAAVPVRSVLLDVQVQIAARRRSYDAAAHDRLFELFGPVADWGTTLRTLLWTRSTLVVPAFEEETVVALDVPCSYDLEVAASRYLDALADGVVPLEFLFTGSVFYTEGELLQTTRLPWNSEAEYALPVAVWKETMERYFRGTAWVRLSKESFDRLSAYKSRNALATWDDALEALGL